MGGSDSKSCFGYQVERHGPAPPEWHPISLVESPIRDELKMPEKVTAITTTSIPHRRHSSRHNFKRQFTSPSNRTLSIADSVNPKRDSANACYKMQRAALQAYERRDYAEAKRKITALLNIHNMSQLESKVEGLHVDIASVCLNIGVCEGQKGNYDEAAILMRQALYIWSWTADSPSGKQNYSQNDRYPSCLDVAKALDNLGTIHFKKNEYRLARDYFHKALDVYRTTLGDNCEKSEYVIETKGNITEMEALMDP